MNRTKVTLSLIGVLVLIIGLTGALLWIEDPLWIAVIVAITVAGSYLAAWLVGS